MRHMASIGIGNCIGGVHRCGTWPASVSSSSGTEPSTRRMLWQGRRWRQRRRLPSMWHLASIGIGIGGIPRCGSWPASVSSSSPSATASAASLDAAPGQHRYRHRQGQNPRPGACFGKAGVGASVVDFHRCGTWPASASASAASLDAAPGQHRYRHRQEPSTRRMPCHSRRWRRHRRLPHGGGRWALGIVRLHAVVSGQPPLRRGVGRLSVLISVRSMRPIQPPL